MDNTDEEDEAQIEKKKVSFRLAIVWLGCVLERRRVLLSVQSNGTSLHNIRRYLLFLLCSNTRRQCYTAIRDHPNESSLVIKPTFNIWNVWKYQTRMQTNKLKKRWFAAPRGCNVSRVHPTMRNMHSYGTNENHFFFIFHFSIIFMAVPALCATIGQKERERETVENLIIYYNCKFVKRMLLVASERYMEWVRNKKQDRISLARYAYGFSLRSVYIIVVVPFSSRKMFGTLG